MMSGTSLPRCPWARGLHQRRHDRGIWWAGVAQGLIHDVPTVADLVQRMVAGAEQIIGGRLAALLAKPMEV